MRVEHSPAQMRLQKGVSGLKFTKFLSDADVSSAVLTPASMLRSIHPLWNASTQNEGRIHCMPIFAEWRQKSVTIATFLERSRKEGRNNVQ